MLENLKKNKTMYMYMANQRVISRIISNKAILLRIFVTNLVQIDISLYYSILLIIQNIKKNDGQK